MARLCGRPGCSEIGAVAYGMVPEDLLFWIVAINEAPTGDPSLLCLRHADAMVVPRGWTLDDRREHSPRLFKLRTLSHEQASTPKSKGRRARTVHESQPVQMQPEQMQIDGTAEIERPDVSGPVAEPEAWLPTFDDGDDLDGLLHVDSPLLARAFRGTDRPKR